MKSNNIDNSDYEFMRELFSKEANIPESTERRIADTCASLESRKQEKKIINIFGRTVTMSRRAAIAAAAVFVFVVCGGTALAAGLLHSDLFQTTFGTGISDNSDDKYYEDANGVRHEFPTFERVEVDEAKAEKALGDYITTLGKQYTKDGTTLTLQDFVVDVNGIGYLSYTLENPDGVSDLIIRYGSSRVDIDPRKFDMPAISMLGSFDDSERNRADERTVINDGLSTDTCAYLVEIFAVNHPIDQITGMKAEIGGESYDLPIDKPVPAREIISDDGQHIFSISPIGMTSKCLVPDCYECVKSELIINTADGDYVVKSEEQNIENTFFSYGYGPTDTVKGVEIERYTTTSIVFNRLVVPAEITSITFKADHDIISEQGSVHIEIED